MRCFQIRLSLSYVLIQLRSFDHGKQLPLLYVRTNVEVPLFEIATGTSKDWSIDERLRGARQNKLLKSSSRIGLDHVHRRNGSAFRCSSKITCRHRTLVNA